jgi:hypothetical protein
VRDPILLRVPQETRDALAGDALVDDVELTIAAARDAWKAGDAPFAIGPNGHAARRVLDHLAERCAVEAAPHTDRSPAIALIAAERRRHEEKGYDARHDDRFLRGELADMGCWYADEAAGVMEWPWDDDWPTRGDRVQDLVRAGSLIAAEIDRLIRSGATP